MVSADIVTIGIVAIAGAAWAYQGDPTAQVGLNDGSVRVTTQADPMVGHVDDLSMVLDGVPFNVRDTANRELLPQLIDDLKAHEPPAAWTGIDGMVPNPEHDDWQYELDGLQNVQKALRDNDFVTLAMLDVDGSRVDAALAIGDVDTADHVGVYTQGLFSGTSKDDGISDPLRQMYDVDALAHQQLLQDGRGGETTAMVMWMGYDSPQNVDVLSDAQAKGGADSLASFADGIRAVNPDTKLVGLGHSYGATVTGLAAQQTDAFDSIVLFGSPGVGTTSMSDLRVPAGQVYALANPLDPVAGSGHFDGGWWPLGTPTTQLDGVTELSTAPSGDLTGPAAPSPWSQVWGLLNPLISIVQDVVTGFDQHNQYLVRGSTAEYNIAAAVADAPDKMIR